MKKIVLAFAIIMMVGVAPASAQGIVSLIKSRVSVGVKGEGNYSGFLFKDAGDMKSTMGVGGGFGGFIKFDITRHIAIQQDFMFVYQTSDLEQNGTKDTYQYLGSEVPIYITGQWGTLSGGRIYAGVGPYLSMGFTAKMKDSDLNLYKKVDGTTPMKRFSGGAAAYIGYEFFFGLQVNVNYKIGATNILDRKIGDTKMFPHSISAGIGYRF
jgi:hypothetical protein